ncbi:hypothetical protein [Endozoicomonas sp. 4G]|uniref:hypothetical protein n=1 Tax=Endozoicomonas sp. 4G TaxID=2872754 RepID=UPI002078A962|nr:hypothetical protein [Endozoicomonas sp. 4G]
MGAIDRANPSITLKACTGLIDFLARSHAEAWPPEFCDSLSSVGTSVKDNGQGKINGFLDGKAWVPSR